MENPEELIPDFNDIDNMARELGALQTQLLHLKNNLKKMEADCIHAALTTPEYWIGGKPPTITYCDKVTKIIGNTSEDKAELEATRNAVAEVTGGAILLQQLLNSQKSRLDLYRTFCANQRKGFLDGN